MIDNICPFTTAQRPARITALLIACIGVGGCATTRPVAYSDLDSSVELKANAADRSGKIPFAFATPVNWRRYYKAIVEPVAVYDGPDAQFGKMSQEDREALAAYMEEQFGQRLATAFEIVAKPGPSTLRIRLTLTGARTTTPVLGTFSRFDLAGGPYNAVQGARGKEGTLTGSVIYAVEIYDAASQKLLLAQVTKQYPNALNIGASFGSLAASRAGVRKGADDLLEQITAASPQTAEGSRR
jgi:hypothetical protein